MIDPQTNGKCPLCKSGSTNEFWAEHGRQYHTCSQCGLVYIGREHLPDAVAEKERYSKHKNNSDDQGYRDYLGKLTGAIVAHLRDSALGLDFGCGPNPVLAEILTENGFDMVSYDPLFTDEPELLERQYDFVTCSETVEHFHWPGNDFDLLDRLIKPGGWLGIMTGMLKDDESFKGWWYTRDFTHVCFYRLITLDWIAGKYGWALMEQNGDVSIFQKLGNAQASTPMPF